MNWDRWFADEVMLMRARQCWGTEVQPCVCPVLSPQFLNVDLTNSINLFHGFSSGLLRVISTGGY